MAAVSTIIAGASLALAAAGTAHTVKSQRDALSAKHEAQNKADAESAATAQLASEESMREEQAKASERKRRALIAKQNQSIKTSPLGASIEQNKLGGTTLTGA